MKLFSLKSVILFFILALGFSTTPVLAGPVLDFQAIGYGTIVEPLPAVNCQSTPGGCTIVSEGTVSGKRIGKGTFTSTIIILWGSSTPNGEGTSLLPNGYCAPASGTATLIAADKSNLTVQEVGIVCEVGPTGTNVPHTFNGTYYITGGTKKFSNATGSGSLTGSDDGTGNVLLNLHGTIMK